MQRDQLIPTDPIDDGVARIVGEHFGVPAENLSKATRLVDDLGADSLDLVEITMEVEEHFDIEVSDEAAERIDTVGDIVSGVRELLESHTAS